MSKNKHFNFNVSTLIGSKNWVLKKLQKEFVVESPYQSKWRKTVWINIGISLLAKFDTIRSKGLLKNIAHYPPPIFIVGHWRSGTTYLHNLICTDSRAGYPTTFQTVFPNNLFAFQRIIKWVMKIFLPDKRPGDGLPLRVDQPQEEEFALGNEIDYCFYYWTYFPKKAAYFRDAHFSTDKIPTQTAHQWKENYTRFVKRSLLNTNGSTFVSKNPPNTGRIKWLLELYPAAKFIFIHRNPYEVYYSTKKFFKGVIPPIQFQDMDEVLFDEHILESYTALHKAYFEQRGLIPAENLIELSYENLIANPLLVMENVAQQFHFPDIEKVKAKLVSKIDQSQQHKVDSYLQDSKIIEKINTRWEATFTRLGYTKRV